MLSDRSVAKMMTPHQFASRGRIAIACACSALAFFSVIRPTSAQTWKPRLATKLLLPSNGNDPSNTITIEADTLSSSSTIVLPASNTDGFMTNDGSGNLAWLTLSSSVLDTAETGTITTTSTSDAVASGMDITTNGGSYLVWFTSSVDINTNTAGLGTTVSIYAGGAQVASSIVTSEAQSGSNRTEPISSMAVVTGLSNGDHIEVRWHTASGKISSMFQRTLIALKIK